ncbi:hypothetical protein ABW20_dc0104717 [Dactylellina cionopaga]|nr:hypothetical protein ABW20_dc0104717 [Dactylellina cionopaga]
MEFLKTPISQWLHRDASLTVGSALVAFMICTVVLYHKLVPATDPREPPLIPYTIPWLGSALSFSRDFHGFMQWVRKVMPEEVPYRIYLGGRTLYLVTSPRLYSKLVRITKTMSFDLLERVVFTRIFEMNLEDADKFCLGMHGMPPPPGMSKEEAEEIALTPKFQKQYQNNWFGQTEGLEDSTNRFSLEWEKRLDGLLGDQKTATTSVRQLMEHHVFWSATSVHFGPHLYEIAPKLSEHFWEFEDGFLKLFQETPKWMLRGPLKAREEMTIAIEKWIIQATEKAPSLSDDILWDEWWGSRVLRQRAAIVDSRGLSLRGMALHQVGLLWGVSNMTARVITDDMDVEGYIMKKGLMMIAPSQAMHLSPVFDHPSHPATEFWAERFMVEGPEKTKLLNSWRPFAGGITYCPGRYLATAEVMSTIGMLLLKFDMKLDEKNGRIQHWPGRSGTGAVRPDRDGYISLRRRE